MLFHHIMFLQRIEYLGLGSVIAAKHLNSNQTGVLSDFVLEALPE